MIDAATIEQMLAVAGSSHEMSRALKTAFDPKTGLCTYTLNDGDHSYSVDIPAAELTNLGADKKARRAYVAGRLAEAINAHQRI